MSDCIRHSIRPPMGNSLCPVPCALCPSLQDQICNLTVGGALRAIGFGDS